MVATEWKQIEDSLPERAGSRLSRNLAMDFYRKWLVETDWLAQHLEAPDIVVLDATFFLPIENRDGFKEYCKEHIPGALRFDIDEIADTTTSLPHMLPPPEKFSACVRRMGIGDGMRVIVYDTSNMAGASRAWWMFRVMGHNDVAILNGGFNKWRAENYPVVSGEPPCRTERHFTARRNAGLVRDLNDMKRIVTTGNRQIVDARATERFIGAAPEPREVLRLGRIPHSKNLPYDTLLNSNGTLKSPREINAIFAESGVEVRKPVVASCGSGVTACVIALALACIGEEQAAVYDGSWAEWSQADTPVETG